MQKKTRGFILIMLCFEYLNRCTVFSDLQGIVESNCLAFVVLQIYVTESKGVVANKSKDAFENSIRVIHEQSYLFSITNFCHVHVYLLWLGAFVTSKSCPHLTTGFDPDVR